MAHTTAQLELVAHIKAENAKTLAWVAEDPQNRWAGTMVSDADHWAGYGVFSVDEYERYLAINMHSELYKGIHGIRPRWFDYDRMTTGEINEMNRQMADEAEKEYKAELKERRETAAKLSAQFNVDVDTLKRWGVL